MMQWPEILTYKTEYNTKEKRQNLIDCIQFAKRNSNPYLKNNIRMWEQELKDFDKNQRKEKLKEIFNKINEK